MAMRGKHKIVRLGVAIAILIVAAGAAFAYATGFSLGDDKTDSSDWAKEAEHGSQVLLESFWDDRRQMFNNASPCMLQLCTDPFNYWWQAHAAGVLLDAYERTKDEAVQHRVGELFDGLLRRNADVWPNDYYDDMEWMALEWLRAYQLFGDDKYKNAVLELWKDIQTGWNEEQGGGIAWRKEQLDYKNTPANAPAVILAARLYRQFGDDADLAWAMKIYDWQKRTLVDPESGLVWDGINRAGDGKIDYDWKFTYGQGVYIGAAVELYRISGEPSYLADARRTADNVALSMASPATGLLPNEGDGDGALFKGILVRYLAQLALADEDSGGSYAGLIFTNAKSLRDYGVTDSSGKFGPSWAQPPETVVQLSSQISGTILMEQAAALERSGMDEQ